MQKKQKHWRRLTAKPNEYLVKLRKGKVVAHGAGLSVFVWPNETCAVIPTSVQKTSFVADQITAEKVGVSVTGIAVYRIADPLMAFRVLDFSEEEQGTEALASILREMFIGAARRLVANMTVQECLTKRKESIAQELMREILPVVSGNGRPDDTTDKGWGVVIDTIEIQDVRILSEKVFSDLQTPFRTELELKAKQSQLKRDEEIHAREVEAQRNDLEADLELTKRRSETQEQSKLDALQREERVNFALIDKQSRLAETKLKAHLVETEREQKKMDVDHELTKRKQEMDAQLLSHETNHAAKLEMEKAQRADQLEMEKAQRADQLEMEKAQRDAEFQRSKSEARMALEEAEAARAVDLAAQKAQAERITAEFEIWLRNQNRETDNSFSDERIRYEFVTNALPSIAQAIAESMGPIHLTRIEGGNGENGNGMHFLTELFAQALAVAKTAGLDPERLWKKE